MCTDDVNSDSMWCYNTEVQNFRGRHLCKTCVCACVCVCVCARVLSVQFSHSVMSSSLRHHGLQHTRPPCPSPTPGVYSNSCPLSLVMPSSYLILCRPLLLLPQSLPASGSFPLSQFFTSGSQNIGVLASTSVLSMNIQDWFPLGWAGWISLQSKGLSESSPTPQFESINSSALSLTSSERKLSGVFFHTS